MAIWLMKGTGFSPYIKAPTKIDRASAPEDVLRSLHRTAARIAATNPEIEEARRPAPASAPSRESLQSQLTDDYKPNGQHRL
jgi:hypothetical protein